jgi:hypothetical protein
MLSNWHCQNPSNSAISASTKQASGRCRILKNSLVYMKHQDGLQQATSMRMMPLFLYEKCVEMKNLISSIILGLISILALPALSANAESGYQTINGTQVYTVIDRAAGVATFSNSCGSQTLTQGQLQAGAIPSQIIPCPRASSSSRQSRCPSGEVFLGNGCAPAGSVDCGGMSYCDAGNICTNDHHCLPRSSVRVCSDGSYCDPGLTCTSDNKCHDEAQERENRRELDEEAAKNDARNACIDDWNRNSEQTRALADSRKLSGDCEGYSNRITIYTEILNIIQDMHPCDERDSDANRKDIEAKKQMLCLWFQSAYSRREENYQCVP